MEYTLPLSVSKKYTDTYIKNLDALTFNGKKTIMFAADQRIEHGLDSFLGKDISTDDISAEHFFRIASKAKVSALATHLGLINKYAADYPNVNYIVKLNSITKLVKENCGYTQSQNLCSVEDVVNLQKESDLNIVGIGYTVYLGIQDESKILKEASQNILMAHKYGLPVILWIYPKPKKTKEDSLENVSSAVMVGEALGADFIKVKPPVKGKVATEKLIKVVTKAAGRSRVLISGGSSISEHKFIEQAYKNIYTGGAAGVAVGRNIHQKPLHQAVEFCDLLYKSLVEGQEPGFDPNAIGVKSIV